MSTVKPIPEGYDTLTPYLVIKDAAKALEFYREAFGAKELFRSPGPGGKIMHAEMQLGSSKLMLADEMEEWKGPSSLGGTPVSLMMYVENVDQVFEQALKAGAKTLRPIENMFYGDRMGTLQDPFGHVWNIGTHVEDVSPEELEKRMKNYRQS